MTASHSPLKPPGALNGITLSPINVILLMFFFLSMWSFHVLLSSVGFLPVFQFPNAVSGGLVNCPGFMEWLHPLEVDGIIPILHQRVNNRTRQKEETFKNKVLFRLKWFKVNVGVLTRISQVCVCLLVFASSWGPVLVSAFTVSGPELAVRFCPPRT